MDPEVDFTSPSTFAFTAFFIFLGIFGRYVLTALLFTYLVKGAFKSKFEAREVQRRPRRPDQDWVEIGWSFVTSVLFALAGTLLLVAWQLGFTKIYLKGNEYAAAWLPVSVLLVLLLHESYYYWLHRWMHRPGVYKRVHKIHHDSITTSAWTSFSFHPVESSLQAVFIPLISFLLPLHIYAIAAVLVIMTLTSAINHLNTELYPRDFNRHWFGRWWIGATHHSLHHSQFRYNYGLYFTFWDKWMGTESPDYAALFEEKTKTMERRGPSGKKAVVKIHQE